MRADVAGRITAVSGMVVTVVTAFWETTDARTVYWPASANVHDTLICPMKPDSTRSPMPDPQSNATLAGGPALGSEDVTTRVVFHTSLTYATSPFALTLTLKLGTGLGVGAGWLVGAGEVGDGATGVG